MRVLLVLAVALGIPAGLATAAHAGPECVIVQLPNGTQIRVCRP